MRALSSDRTQVELQLRTMHQTLGTILDSTGEESVVQAELIFRQIEGAENALRGSLGRPPTEDEIAGEIGEDVLVGRPGERDRDQVAAGEVATIAARVLIEDGAAASGGHDIEFSLSARGAAELATTETSRFIAP